MITIQYNSLVGKYVHLPEDADIRQHTYILGKMAGEYHPPRSIDETDPVSMQDVVSFNDAMDMLRELRESENHEPDNGE